MSSFQVYGDSAPARDLTHVRKVYLWLLVGILVSAATAWSALNLGDTVMTVVDQGMPPMPVPTLVSGALAHPYLLMFAYFGALGMALISRKVGFSSVGYLLFTAFSGLLAGPLLFVAQFKAAHYETLSAHPIRDSFLLTLAAFVGLSAYAWTTKRDLSWMKGFLWVGLWVTLAATVMCIFCHSHVFEMAVDSAVVLLFSGYILYDTQRVINKSDGDAIGDALNLFLDVFNIFIRLVGIMSSSKDD